MLDLFRVGKKEITDSCYLVLLQGVNQLLPVFVMPYLMIKLGASGYGYVGFSLSFIQYLVLLVDFGFNLSATKHIAVSADRYERSKVFWNVVAAKVVLLLAATVAMFLLIALFDTFQVYSKAIFATYPMVLGSTFTFMWFYQGIGRIRLFSVINTVSKLLLLPLIFIYVKQPSDYLLAAFLQAAVFLSTAVLSNIYMFVKKWVCYVRPSMQGIKKEIACSFPLFLSSASTSVYTQLTVIVLGFFCTAETVGLYSSADRIMRAVCFLFYTPLSQVFFPKVSTLAAKRRDDAVQLFRQVRCIVMAVMIVVCFSIFIGSGWISCLLGDDYRGLAPLLKIFSFVPLAIGIGGVYGQIGLIALGDDMTARKFRNVYFAAALFSAVSICAATPVFFAVGACWATALTELLVAVMMYYNYKKYLCKC